MNLKFEFLGLGLLMALVGTVLFVIDRRSTPPTVQASPAPAPTPFDKH